MGNWIQHLLILFGLKKFDTFAASQPDLPQDSLAVALTLDGYSTKGALTVIAAALGKMIEGVLHGTETLEQAGTQTVIILAGVSIVWVRHAVSKNSVKLDALVKQAQDTTGIKPEGN